VFAAFRLFSGPNADACANYGTTMLPRSTQIVVALVFLLSAASGVRGLITRLGILDHSPPIAGVKPSIDIQFERIIPGEFRNFRATKCNVMASISNSTRYWINDLTVRVGNTEFRFDNVGADEHRDRAYVGSVDLANGSSSCADQALYILNHVAHMPPWACAVDGLPQDECRSFARISTRMGPDIIAGLQDDESEMDQRNMAKMEDGIPREISFITDNIDNKPAPGRGWTGAMTNDVVVLNYTTTRYFVVDGPQAGWHDAPYAKCSNLSVLNKGGLAAFNASFTQSHYIPSGYVWYARPTDGSVLYGQVRIADIAPAEFVAKCDAATGIAELELPNFHADGTPIVVK
jgi:hypothetical protein